MKFALNSLKALSVTKTRFTNCSCTLHAKGFILHFKSLHYRCKQIQRQNAKSRSPNKRHSRFCYITFPSSIKVERKSIGLNEYKITTVKGFRRDFTNRDRL